MKCFCNVFEYHMANTKLLLEDIDKEYDISKEDILIYADQIGIDVKNEKHLMWIAEQGLAANVPKPWIILSDRKDRIFYYNPKTNEKSWHHPLDKEFAALVSEERTKSKSLNSVSSDYGFESKPLDSINDPTQSGRFPKAPLQLSSLADAPPLSSSGKSSPLPPTRGKNDASLSSRRFEFGRIENRRGAQLAPVRLNTLKMPASSTAKSGGMSFMPKGATLSKNIRKVKEGTSYSNQVEEGLDYRDAPPDDSNESVNSDEGSKYSYEETDDEGKHDHGLQPYDTIDTSQLSPMHSADESPDALDINSLVQLGTKMPQRFENNRKTDHIENVSNKENSPALSLRKVGQPSLLKPLSQITKKKSANKGSKAAKKPSKIKYPTENDDDYEDKISMIHDEQKIMMEQIQNEWLAMQDELEKQEKEKYEDMLRDSSKKLEEEEIKLRKENSEKISKIKEELKKKIEEEENTAEKSLETLKAANKEKIIEEEKKLQKELESLKNEIKDIQEKNAAEVLQKKQELQEAFNKEIESLKLAHESNKKDIEKDHASEISNLQKFYEQKIEAMKCAHQKEVDEVKNKISDSTSPNKSEYQEKTENLKLLFEEESENYQKLLKDKEAILSEINSEKENLVKLKKETTETQAKIEELHDEIEKTENDLDLLRSEKSGLISELNILKENINNEKSNLLNLENKVKSSIEAHCSKEFSEIGINTNTAILDVVCKAVQASVTCNDASSQMKNVIIPVSNVMCQTSMSVTGSVVSKSCQTDSVPSTNIQNAAEICDEKRVLNSSHIDKHLENALSGLNMKLDSRMNVIEQQLRLLQENLPRHSTSQPVFSNQEFMQNQFTEVRTVPNSDNQNIPPVYSTDSSVPLGLFSNSIPVSSQNKCKCKLGDSASCDVLQDVKNSVYRLNDILCTTFVPPTSISNFYQVSQPMNYSSPFDSFYTQLRNMQEKHRLTELKHKCENEAVKIDKGPSNITDTSAFASFQESVKPSYHLMHSSVYSYNMPEDPIRRARNIVLKEQARAWKEQHLLNTSVPHIFSLKSSSESSQSSFAQFPTSQNVPSSEETFLNFEVDPETDYNMWMTRLNALQLRIRSHKMI